MGFLHKLWDDTVAGPAPESGLGRLRKYNSFATARPPPLDIPIPEPADGVHVSRSITVLRSPNSPRKFHSSIGSPTPPASPAGSSTPSSPFSPTTPGGNFKKFTRRKPKFDASSQIMDSETKTGFDWIVMKTALDP